MVEGGERLGFARSVLEQSSDDRRLLLEALPGPLRDDGAESRLDVGWSRAAVRESGRALGWKARDWERRHFDATVEIPQIRRPESCSVTLPRTQQLQPSVGSPPSRRWICSSTRRFGHRPSILPPRESAVGSSVPCLNAGPRPEPGQVPRLLERFFPRSQIRSFPDVPTPSPIDDAPRVRAALVEDVVLAMLTTLVFVPGFHLPGETRPGNRRFADCICLFRIF